MTKKERTNEEWLAELRPPPRDETLADLRVLLVRGLGAALRSRRNVVSRETVEDFAQEALVKVLGNLGSFRGESRFTTWAQKISVRVALTELRRLHWRDVSLDEALERHEQTGSRKDAFADEEPTPEELSTRADAGALVRKFIDQELTDKQRVAMTVVMFEGMPLEEAARRMGTTRGALYKLMHDARKRLKMRMEEDGLSPKDLLEELAQG
jgi:RNA polymerase sigma-70 factor (ECF subfamily)